MKTVTDPVGWTRTSADSYRPMPRPNPLGPTARDGARPQISVYVEKPIPRRIALLSQRGLLGAERVEVDDLERAVERDLVVARVVRDPVRRRVREGIGRDQVLAAQSIESIPSSVASWSIITSSMCVISGRPAPRIASVKNLFVNTPVMSVCTTGIR